MDMDITTLGVGRVMWFPDKLYQEVCCFVMGNSIRISQSIQNSYTPVFIRPWPKFQSFTKHKLFFFLVFLSGLNLIILGQAIAFIIPCYVMKYYNLYIPHYYYINII
ncbi:hypothetical protein ACJW30_05G144300 [Castanea mollissima]